MISEKSAENHYKIDVKLTEHAIPIRKQDVEQTYRIKDGNEAVYMTISGFNVLVFQRGSWQYRLSIDKRVSDKVTPEILVEIAESIENTNEP